MSEHVADPQVVCPFVAFDEDRDHRSAGPDHRHRCFAESPAAPRALAHQAAYCLVGAFPGCPTFVDWARREAAPPKTESPVRSLRGPAGAPRGAPGAAAPSASAVDSAPRRSDNDWAAPPPWAGAAVTGAAAGGALVVGDGRETLVDDEDDQDLVDERPATGVDDRRAGSPPDDTPAFLAGRSGRTAPAPPASAPPPPASAWVDDEPWSAVDDLPQDDRDTGLPAPRPVAEPRRVPVGYAPVAPAKNQRRAGGSGRARTDPAAPSWEEPRRSEAYPTLKSRGGGGIPRPAIIALVIVLVGIGLFATPMLLKGLGGSGDQASPTPAASSSIAPTAEPSATPKPAPEQVIYTVKKGDVLSKIAAKYGVTVEQIMKANPKIKNPNMIAPGDKIVIPQPLPTTIVNEEITPAP